MKILIIFFTLFAFPICVFSQKSLKIEVSFDNNSGYKFSKDGFSIGIPFEFQKEKSSISIAFNYARKHNLTVQHKPIRIDTIVNTNCNFICWGPFYDYFYAARQFKINYIQIPLEYKRYFNARKEFFYKIGIYGAIALSGKVSNFEEDRHQGFLGTSSSSPIYSSNLFKNLYFKNENVKRIDAGYMIGLGFTIFRVDLNCRVERSFFNLNRSSDFTIMKNTTFSLVANVPLRVLKEKK
jgi:hypothetical protein